MAETGAVTPLTDEVAAAIDAGTASSTINGPSVSPSPGMAMIPEIQVSKSYSQVTLVTMIAPSPDWFVGVNGLSLWEDGDWVESKTVELHAYDAGTEEGTGFSISNSDTTPHEPIQSLSDHSLGSFTFIRLPNLEHRLYLPC
ncbi:MAG: hypothetical protein HC802_18725 [Caldilineaceae bacterium]|nr:hypothetical protein [Caldilineaceae bacterium]